ncbi:MAG: hypothetical protein MHMPM18_005018 [Marteilia pararefringens]
MNPEAAAAAALDDNKSQKLEDLLDRLKKLRAELAERGVSTPANNHSRTSELNSEPNASHRKLMILLTVFIVLLSFFIAVVFCFFWVLRRRSIREVLSESIRVLNRELRIALRRLVSLGNRFKWNDRIMAEEKDICHDYKDQSLNNSANPQTRPKSNSESSSLIILDTIRQNKLPTINAADSIDFVFNKGIISYRFYFVSIRILYKSIELVSITF